MYKLVMFMLLSVVFMMLYAMQIDRELAVHTLFQAKYALNRSAHAAAQQINLDKLAEGIVSIDEMLAYETALAYLQANLHLDEANMPQPDSFLQSKVEVIAFDVVNEQAQFPYKYVNVDYAFQVEVAKPSVIMMIRLSYPRSFSLLGPITWEVKGTAELFRTQ